MLQSVLILSAAPTRFGDLVEEYRRVAIIEAAIPFGLLRGEAVHEVVSHRLIVTSLWRDAASYESWLTSDERTRVTAGLGPLTVDDQDPVIVKIPRRAGTDPSATLPLDGIATGPTIRVLLVVA
ncbi:hypothetical protein [Rhodococcus sp. 077-4]|uniref:hypothetical protein n=1 Tax=Rhodococcus sp. 077-4 TaxID=2789271 RepID=UPI0039F482E8